jgi:hypothetical protein
MPMRQVPSGDLFVIHINPRAPREVFRRVAPLGEVEELENSMLLLHAKRSSNDVRKVWESIRELIRADEDVQPVLLDERGLPHFPTGEVSVRFLAPQSDEQLRRFAEDHSLVLRHRNEFVREQATFEPVDRNRTFLPEAVDRIAEDRSVKAVWPNTLSRFEKVGARV